MKNYTGKANTLDGAIRQAAQGAAADIGPDALVGFSLEEVGGVHGGIRFSHEIEVVITISDEQIPKCKEASAYWAYQKKNAVTAVGLKQHPTAGYLVALELSSIDIYPHQGILTHRVPKGQTAQVITPFVVSSSFRADSSAESVIVENGKGIQKIPVKQIDMNDE